MSNITKKIAAIVAKAESTTSPEEAATFMAKAHKMLKDHGLSLLDLDKMSDDPATMVNNAYTSSISQVWFRRLFSALGRYYGCRVAFHTHKVGRMYIYSVAGRESARATLLLMAPFVKKQVHKLAAEEAKKGNYKSRREARPKIAQALMYRLAQLTVDETEPLEGSGPNALVPVDILEQLMGNTKVMKASTKEVTDHDIAVAERVNINVQAPAPENALQLESKQNGR